MSIYAGLARGIGKRTEALGEGNTLQRTNQVAEKLQDDNASTRVVPKHIREEYRIGNAIVAVHCEASPGRRSEDAQDSVEQVCLEESLEVEQVCVSLRLPRDTYEAIGLAALGEGLSQQQVMIRLLEHGLSRMPHTLKPVANPHVPS